MPPVHTGRDHSDSPCGILPSVPSPLFPPPSGILPSVPSPHKPCAIPRLALTSVAAGPAASHCIRSASKHQRAAPAEPVPVAQEAVPQNESQMASRQGQRIQKACGTKDDSYGRRQGIHGESPWVQGYTLASWCSLPASVLCLSVGLWFVRVCTYVPECAVRCMRICACHYLRIKASRLVLSSHPRPQLPCRQPPPSSPSARGCARGPEPR